MAPRRDNQKAVEARERKAQQAAQKKEAELKAKEDAKWKDEGSKLQRQKEQRKQEAESKAEGARRRREERQLLEQQELASIQGTNKGSLKAGARAPKRLTQFEILARLAKQAADSKKLAASQTSSLVKPSGIVSSNDGDLMPNVNHMRRAEAYDALLAGETVIDTTGIDQTLKELESAEVESGKIDMHPERRARVAFKAFEERSSAQLREEFPDLKRSQINERIHKLWQKSPENPMVNG